MPHMDTEKILNALQVLEEEGRKSYKPEYAEGIPAWRAIGKAVAHATDSARNILDLAYTALEDHNHHSINAVLEWIFPLYDQVFHVSDLQRLERMINKKSVTVLTEWNTEKTDYDTKQVNVRLEITDA